MRVNISYSVDLEDVPTTVNRLIHEMKKESFLPLNKKIDDLLLFLSQGNEKRAVQLVDEVRQDLAKMDLRLLDCGGILEGYQNASLNKKSTKNSDPNQESA